MQGVRFEAVTEDNFEDWRQVHNAIIPTSPLSSAEVRERMGRNRLRLAYVGEVLVGCSTVRPPLDEARTATVIVRVLPEHRRQGIGSQFYDRELEAARGLGAVRIETVVLESNADGLRFALAKGFVELERYVLDGHEAAFIDLLLTADTSQGTVPQSPA